MTILLQTLLILLCSAIVHEFGHYIAAQLMQVRVTKIRIGLWHHILTFRMGATQVEWGLLPWGGYTGVHGMAPGDKRVANVGDYRTLHPLQQAVVIAGGVLGNLTLAALIYGVLAAWSGTSVLHAIVAGAMAPGHVLYGIAGMWCDAIGITLQGAPQMNVLDGTWLTWLYTLAACNVIIAVINLLPIKGSDGSRLIQLTART